MGYLNGITGGFGASCIFMAGALFLSSLLTIVAVKGSGVKLLKEFTSFIHLHKHGVYCS